ncbi:hypothetical protein JCM11641_008153 [Rhodosporidiobolus odoratus]
MTITANQVVYWLKKAFRLFKKAKKQYDQHQTSQGQQSGGQPQQGSGAWGQQQQQQASPYPPAHQQQQGAWNQGHGTSQAGGYGGKVSGGYGGNVSAGGYGAHDGPATVRLSPPLSSPLTTRDQPPTRSLDRQRLPLEVVELAVRRARSVEAGKALDLSQRWRLTPMSTLLRSAASPYHTSTLPLSIFAFSSTFSRAFSTISHPRRSPSRPQPPRPQLPYYDAAFRPRPPPPKPIPPPPPSTLIPLTIFSRIPSYLRPSYRTILELVGWDRLIAGLRGAMVDIQNQDMANAQNAHYVELRNQAIREGDLMAKAFSSSKQAYASGNGEAAHNLSMEGKHHQRNKDQYNAEAAEWIYRENNRTQSPGSIDLHGLYVQEAVDYTEKAIQQARSQGMQELKVIVGKGNHSPSHVAKIKPAITQLMEKERLSAHLDPNNGGVLVVLLQGQGGGRAGGQFVREMEQSSGNDCVVM